MKKSDIFTYAVLIQIILINVIIGFILFKQNINYKVEKLDSHIINLGGANTEKNTNKNPEKGEKLHDTTHEDGAKALKSEGKENSIKVTNQVKANHIEINLSTKVTLINKLLNNFFYIKDKPKWIKLG